MKNEQHTKKHAKPTQQNSHYLLRCFATIMLPDAFATGASRNGVA